MGANGNPSDIPTFYRFPRLCQPVPAIQFVGYMPQVPRKGEHIWLGGEWRRVIGVDWRFDNGPNSWEAILDLEEK
jgi:hypothetical protein